MANVTTLKSDTLSRAPRTDDSGAAVREAARLRRILDRVDQEIHIIDPETLCFLEMNRAARRNLGYSADEFRSMTPCDVIPDLSMAELRRTLTPLLAGNRDELQLEAELHRKDGSRCPVTVRLELDTSADPPQLICYLTDQTDAIELLAQVRLAADAGAFHFTKWDLERGRISRDPEVDRLYGFDDYDPKRMMADFRARVAPEDLPGNIAALEAIARHDIQVFDRTFRVRLQNGEHRWLRAIGQLSNHNPNVVIGLQCDITETIRAERAREAARKELDSLLTYLPDYISRAEPDTTLTYVNAPYARFLNDTPDNLIGRRFRDFVTEQHRAALQQGLEGLTPGAPMITTEERTIAPDGTVTCLLWTNIAIFDGETPIELISIGRDISEQDNARRTIQAQADDLERSNQALRESDERFRLAVSGASVGIWDWPLNEDGKQFWSERLYELLGMEPGAVPAHIDSFTKLVHPDDLDTMTERIERHLRTGEPYECTLRICHASGEYRWFLDTGMASRDECGEPLRMVGTMMDVNDRMLVESELRESEARFRSLYNDTPVMLHSIDASGRLISVSDYWLEKMGYRREEVLGQLAIDFMTEASRQEALDERLPEFFRTGAARDIPYEMVRKDGTVIDVLLSANAIPNADGRIDRSLAVVTDVTEKKMAELELSRQKQELQLIFENVPVKIFYKDGKNHVLKANRQAAESLGLTVEQAEGCDVYDIFDNDQATTYHADDIEVIKSGKPKLGVIKQFTPVGGAPSWISSNKVPYTDPVTGEPRILLAVGDITELKNAQLTMAEQAKALQRSNEELEQFAYIASHDLRAPLRGIDNLASWIEEDMADNMDEESRNNMALLRSRVARLELLLNSLLQYSRIGRSKTEVTKVDLGKVAADVFELVCTDGRFTFASAETPELVTGTVPLELVLRNLFSNAIKHHDQASGLITLEATEESDRIHIAVTDDGPGIAPAFHRQIFGMFQVLKPRDQVEASGLGLAMIDKQLRALDCRIWVESDPAVKRGTTFHFTWPKTWPYGTRADATGDTDAE